MEQKKNLCAMIPADLHAKVMAEKEQLDLKTLGEYVELILKEHFRSVYKELHADHETGAADNK